MKYIILYFALINIVFANTPIEKLGERLYFDPILSKNKTQSCATCHNPSYGFIDNRPNIKKGAVSLGDDGKSFGGRNAPTVSYAAFSPNFYFKNGKAIGGQFLDGREKDLKGQAGGPPLNPAEMGMPNKKAVVNRLKDNEFYNKEFKKLFGNNIFNDVDTAYLQMTKSIAVFEKTKFFAPFDSKYDRYLRGEYELTTLEDLGKSLFFSNNNTNCASCHQLKTRSEAKGETFSNYEYHNIGTPKNPNLDSETDFGLFHHTKDEKDKGKFKVPTLRNIAVTAPYMHNGVFKELHTVVKFYDKYISKDRKSQINPETRKRWDAPEVSKNISLDLLKKGKKLGKRKVNALVAFLKTLTDRRFEHLIQNNVKHRKFKHKL